MNRQPHRGTATRPPKSEATLPRAIRLRLALSPELLEEAKVVVQVVAQVADRVPEVGDPLDPHPEGEALVALRVQSPVPQDDRMDHPRPQDRHPAGPRTGGTADPAADDTFHVEGHGRLGERVVARPEAGPLAAAEHRVGELDEQA